MFIVKLFRLFLFKVSGLAMRIERRLPVPAITLAGDRAIENSWVAAHMPPGPGKALDFGPGDSHLWLSAAMSGYEVLGIDLRAPKWFYKHSNIEFVLGDILDHKIAPDNFDLIVNCSSIEHVGLVGRYGVNTSNEEGDFQVMKLLLKLIKPTGKMILTIPIGQDSVFPPLHRVYGRDRLPLLLSGWETLTEEYWNKDDCNLWAKVDKETALSRKPVRDLYGLGCFVLQPSQNHS